MVIYTTISCDGICNRKGDWYCKVTGKTKQNISNSFVGVISDEWINPSSDSDDNFIEENKIK